MDHFSGLEMLRQGLAGGPEVQIGFAPQKTASLSFARGGPPRINPVKVPDFLFSIHSKLRHPAAVRRDALGLS